MDWFISQNIAGWLAGEKLDGVFARWTGTGLFSRDGILMTPPPALVAGVEPCEGELVHADGLQRVQNCRHFKPDDSRWTGVRFVPHASIPELRVANATEAAAFMAEIVARGGEGIVLRNPETGERLKMKPTKDAEAEVIGYTPGKCGIGALLVRFGEVTFGLGSGLSSRVRLAPPPIGAHINFTFCGFTDSGLPRNASFRYVRTWA